MKVARVAAGLSQTALAEKVGSYQLRVSRLERGTSIPDPDEIQKLAQVLGVPKDQLFVNDASPATDFNDIVGDIFNVRLGARR